MNNPEFTHLELSNFDKIFFSSSQNVLKGLKSKSMTKILMPKLKLLLGGEDYYHCLFNIVKSAKSHIFCVMYTIDDSELANKVLTAFAKAAERGVSVIIIVDDLISKLNATHHTKLIESGAVVVNRNTAKSVLNMHDKSFFQRDHEKAIFIDNKFLIGSANLSSDYGGKLYGNNFFLDLNVFGKNCLIPEFVSMIEDLILSMKEDFKKEQVQILNDLYKYKSAYGLSPFFKDRIKLVYCKQPNNMSIQNTILREIRNAKKRIRIIAPYYYSVKALNEALIDASIRGIDIEIVTSVSRDIPAYKDFSNGVLFKKLISKGMKIYEYGDQYLHAKGLLIDDSYVSVGSFNMDRWSWYNNIELMIDVYNHPKYLQEFDRIFNELKARSSLVKYNDRFEVWQSTKIYFWRTFHFFCNKLMNRGFYGYYQNMDNSLLEKMHSGLSWDVKRYQKYNLLKIADQSIGKIALNEIKNKLNAKNC